jgi:L-ribulose-5-phosphate 4-epimerase
VSDSIEELREKVTLGARILAKLELGDESCHVSARVPGSDQFIIRACRLPERPDEGVMHAEIYKARPDVMAIAHTHQPLATMFADIERAIVPIGGTGTNICFGDAAVYPSARPVTTFEQAAELARTLADRPYVFLRNHGMTFVAAKIEEAVIHPIWLEFHAQMTLTAASFGTPVGLGREETMLKAKERFGIEARWRYYVSLLSEGAQEQHVHTGGRH